MDLIGYWIYKPKKRLIDLDLDLELDLKTQLQLWKGSRKGPKSQEDLINL